MNTDRSRWFETEWRWWILLGILLFVAWALQIAWAEFQEVS